MPAARGTHLHCPATLASAQKNVYNRRAVEFVGVVAGQARDTEQVELVESLVGELVGLADAAEHVARWRACELLAAVMLSFSAEDGLSVEVLGALQEAMLERLDDAKPAVRAAAARALRRLPEAGEVRDRGAAGRPMLLRCWRPACRA